MPVIVGEFETVLKKLEKTHKEPKEELKPSTSQYSTILLKNWKKARKNQKKN